jgi:chromate transporter
MDTGPSRSTDRTRLLELASLFLRLGVLGFGGPAAHIAMMDDEVVRRRRWLTRSDFLDLLGATNLNPGPNSTEMAIHIGHRRGGWPGLVIAGMCFILPAALITAALGWVYVRYGALPQARWILYGVKPVIIAVVVQALWGLGRAAMKTRPLGVLGALAFAASLADIDQLVILGSAGALAVAIARAKRDVGGASRDERMVLPPGLAAVAGASAAVGSSVSLGGLFFVFAKIGSVLFGSGYVLLAFLRSDLVQQRHWLTEQQLLDAIAVGQITPGPVFTTATFIGFVIRGGTGAVVATLGIFLPAFVFVALSGPFVPRLRASPIAGAILDGVNVASLGLMAAVTAQLSRTALVDVPAVVMALVSAVLLLRFKISSVWLVLAGVVCGTLVHVLR